MVDHPAPPNFNEGFTESNDTFGRKNFFKQVMRVVNNAPEKNLVMSLDDNWGNGKTTFVQMMKAEIESKHTGQYNVIYFDAFENDYQSDPFISLTAQIYSSIKKEESKLKPFKEKFINISKKVGASLFIGGMKAVISTATAGVINGGETVEAIASAGKDSAEKLTNDLELFIEKKITSVDEEKADIHNFRNILKEMHSSSEIKTIFIIDELDRARPDYALDLLEKVKHIFSVEGVIFMLVMNRGQFEKSIEQRYGQIDSRTYLNKFINYWLTLPKVRIYDFTLYDAGTETTLLRHLNMINKERKLLSRNGQLIKCLSFLLDINGCSLREAERCYSLLQITNDADSLSRTVNSKLTIIALIVFMKVCKPEVLESFMRKEMTSQAYISKIRFDNLPTYVPSEINLLNKAIEFHFLSKDQLEQTDIQRMYDQFIGEHHSDSIIVEYYKKIENLSLS